jgi:hypothetical protein
VSRIAKCEFCGNEGSPISGTRQAELYDGIAEVMMCWKCEPAAEFERKRIIKLLKEATASDLITGQRWQDSVIDLIKGENK